MAEKITFTAAVSKVSTLADGGIRVALDMGEGELLAMAQLAKCQQAGVVLKVTVETVETKVDDGL